METKRIVLHENKTGFELVIDNKGVEVNIYTTKGAITKIPTINGKIVKAGIVFEALSKKIERLLSKRVVKVEYEPADSIFATVFGCMSKDEYETECRIIANFTE